MSAFCKEITLKCLLKSPKYHTINIISLKVQWMSDASRIEMNSLQSRIQILFMECMLAGPKLEGGKVQADIQHIFLQGTFIT